MPTPSPSFDPLEALRAQVRAIEVANRSPHSGGLPFGIETMDCRLAGGGLAISALHELTGSNPNLNDDAAATLFGAGLAARAGEGRGMVLWIRTSRDLFAPGLAQAGLPPHRLIYADCGCNEDALAVMEEGLRHDGLAAVVADITLASMTATRRLQLAAEQSGVIGLMLRRWRRNGQDPLASPSAAVTRWRIGCVPSQVLPVSGISRPRWKIELVRQRGGPSCEWIMEGTDEAGCLALPAEPSHRSPAADGWERAARSVA